MPGNAATPEPHLGLPPRLSVRVLLHISCDSGACVRREGRGGAAVPPPTRSEDGEAIARFNGNGLLAAEADRPAVGSDAQKVELVFVILTIVFRAFGSKQESSSHKKRGPVKNEK